MQQAYSREGIQGYAAETNACCQASREACEAGARAGGSSSRGVQAQEKAGRKRKERETERAG